MIYRDIVDGIILCVPPYLVIIVTWQELFSLLGSGLFQDVAEVLEGLGGDELVVFSRDSFDGLHQLCDVERLRQGVKRRAPVDHDREDARLQRELTGAAK